jgi:hypothetical protein
MLSRHTVGVNRPIRAVALAATGREFDADAYSDGMT